MSDNFKPTLEQEAIIAAVKETSDNILVAALAGAAKTSTLVLIARAQPKIAILCLAFNKKIQVEMSERLPSNCEAKTLNGLGHNVWGKFLGRRLVLQTSKTYKIVKDLVDDLKGKEKDDAYAIFSDVIRAVDQGKSCGYIPTGKFPIAKRLMDDDEFFDWLDEEPSDLMCDLIRRATIKSIEQGLDGLIDFGDQIILPTVFPASFPQYPLVMVDEAQDLSALNHATLRKLVKKRIIAVGDECQSIYGFRGAHQDSMNLLESQFNMRKLILSISFRCPKAVVEVARWRAPHMQWPEWAKEGEVRHLKEWSIADLSDNTVIICRNNAPIFSMAIRLLKNGRYPQIIGNDISKSLVKILKSFGPADTPRMIALDELSKWEQAKLKKSRDPKKVNDQAACLEIFLNQGETIGDAIAYAEYIMNSAGPIRLMTGHKSKGLEFPDVFFLDPHLLKMDLQQEQNLRYVIETRAQEKLTYVNSDDFVEIS